MSLLVTKVQKNSKKRYIIEKVIAKIKLVQFLIYSRVMFYYLPVSGELQ